MFVLRKKESLQHTAEIGADFRRYESGELYYRQSLTNGHSSERGGSREGGINEPSHDFVVVNVKVTVTALFLAALY